MKTKNRLDSAMENARILHFDKQSKIIFFSDLHRGDDSVSDEFSKNQTVFLHAMEYYYDQGFTYVEVGDGDDLWEYKDFKVIRLAHADVFNIMRKFYRQDRLIFLYGNHNVILKDKEYVKRNFDHFCDEYNQNCELLFPNIQIEEALLLKNKKSGKEILVVHGHQGDFWNDQAWRFSRFLLRYFWRYLHVVGFRNPASPAKTLYKRHKIEKSFKRWIVSRKRALICGHTHRPRFPKEHSVPYYNTGCGIHTKGVTGIELINGKLQMVDWRMSATEDGTLKVTRNIVGGPRAV
jgi:UDP-2,3-diacylglucosamine pyrophosphatase LpxH